MPMYDNKVLRWEILKTIGSYAAFGSFRVKAILNALRPTGFESLTEPTLMAQLRYLELKGYLTIEKTKNLLTEEEYFLITITPKGIDLLENRFSDMGVACA